MKTIKNIACILLASSTLPAFAADWSDTQLSVRHGSQFAEPFNAKDVRKTIVAITHASGYKYGSNFVNVDFLKSDSNDPGSLTQSSGAQEVYIVYRHTLDLAKMGVADFKWGPFRGAGVTLGFDVNTKNDVGYNSRKRMLVAGPTLMFDVPGFLNMSLLALDESNAPSGAFPPVSLVRGRYTYDMHPMLTFAWGIPVAQDWSFEGYANFIASKGKSETGADTGPETNIDMQLMYTHGQWRVGLGYQFWHNKFGNTARTTGGRGYEARTPMVKLAYRF
jgi:opacity protein-like surface antigen